ncbi:VWA domain-containing protein [Sulfurimonas sp.]
MTFLHPEFLYYMLPPLIILFGLLLTQKEVQETFFSQEVMQKLRVSANTLTLKARNALFMLIGVLIVIALANPVIQEGKVEVKAKSADIMIALDISDSMLAEDVYPNRLKLAKQKALEFLRLAPNERVGVIAFAKNSYLVSPLSFDHGAVGFLLRKLNTSSITEKGTDFMSMLEVVDRSIKKESKKYLLVLSDGGDTEDFSTEIAFAKKHNIVVFVLGVGTTKGAPIKMKNGEFIKQNGKIIISKLNENIANLATKTGGVYIEGVNSNADVKAMLKEIEAHAQKKELKSQEISRFIPLFYYPLGLALLLLLIATSSMSKRIKVEVPSMFLLALFAFNAGDAHAGVLDFMDLDKAKKAYQNKEYEKSAKIYDAYAKKANRGESYYNAGNALYKQGKYKEALKNYEQATFNENTLRAKNFANMGNSYAKMGSEENLKKAIESYENSLKIQKDKDVQENLEAVKKALQKKKKQNQQKQNQQKNQKQDQKNQNQKNQNQNKQNKDNKENKENKKNKQNSQEQQQQNQNTKDNKSKQDSQKQQDSKQKSQNSKEQERKSKKQSEEEKKNQEKNSEKKEQENKQNKSNEQDAKDKQKNKQNAAKDKEKKSKSKALEELKNKQKKSDKKEKSTAEASSMQMKNMKNKMSDAEEAKWLKALNKQQSTYLYMLNKNNKVEENPNEKPW